MGSGALLLTLAMAAAQIPFGAEIAVRCREVPDDLRAGAGTEGWLVTSVERPTDSETWFLHLRPMALGLLPPPCAGAEPANVEVLATLAPDARPAPPRLLVPDGTPWAALVLATMVAGIVLLAWILTRRLPRPERVLARNLRPLARGDAWQNSGAADLLAQTCRSFLNATTGLPAHAMTARELAASLPPGEPAAGSTLEALCFCDLVRYAGASPATGPEFVHRLLAAWGDRQVGR
jgi:hypothetical protein